MSLGEMSAAQGTANEAVKDGVTEQESSASSWISLKDAVVAAAGPFGALAETMKSLNTEFQYTSTALGTIGWQASEAGVRSYNDALIATMSATTGVDTSTAGLTKTLRDSEAALKAAHDAAQALAAQWQEADKIGSAAATTFAKLPVTFDQFVAAIDDGGQSAKSMLSQINKEISTLEQTAAGMSGAPKANLLDWVDALNLAKEDIQEWNATIKDNTLSLADQKKAMEADIQSIVQHAANVKDDDIASQMQAATISKGVLSILQQTGALGDNAAATLDVIRQIQEHQTAISADLPTVVAHTGALSENTAQQKLTEEQIVKVILAVTNQKMSLDQAIDSVRNATKAHTDLAAATDKLTQSHKALADAVQQTTIVVNLQSDPLNMATLHAINLANGIDQVDHSENGLEAQTRKTTQSIVEQSNALNGLYGVAAQVNAIFAQLDAEMGGLAGLGNASSSSGISGTLGGTPPPGYYSSPVGQEATSQWVPPFHAALQTFTGMITDAAAGVGAALNSTDDGSLTSAVSSASDALVGTGGLTGAVSKLSADMTGTAAASVSAASILDQLQNSADAASQALATAGTQIASSATTTSATLYALSQAASTASATKPGQPQPTGVITTAPGTTGTPTTGTGGNSLVPMPIGVLTTINQSMPTVPSTLQLSSPSSSMTITPITSVSVNAPITINGATNPQAVAQAVFTHMKSASSSFLQTS
jgi:hypothetical protein